MLRVFVDHCLAQALAGELSADVAAMAKLVGSRCRANSSTSSCSCTAATVS
jgi:hypothetical protein